LAPIREAWHRCVSNFFASRRGGKGSTTMAWDRDAFENAMIEDMRAHDGVVTSGPLAGHPLLIMTSTGAKSGEPRRAILTWSEDAGDYVVAGTAGGSPVTPAWVHNVEAHPDVTIEVKNRTGAATATVIADGPERDRLWDQHVAKLPNFADYPAQTGRLIPMIRITPATEG
jgi:deazaflavin-dependent oxidoreductase (nitroreductase family)